MTALAARDHPGESDAVAPPPRSLAIRQPALLAWLEDAEAGARIEYHRGFLPLDRHRAVSPYPEHQRRELDGIATQLMTLAETGWVLLIQERHGECDYSYVAIKATRRGRHRTASGRIREIADGAAHRHR